MADQYFSYLPNFEYVSRLPDSKRINDFVQVKNIFKRAAIREDIFEELAFFTKYQIEGNERPDNVAYNLYQDENLDWLVMLANNYVNYETEWPLDQQSFENYLLSKYGSTENIYKIHHYESDTIRDSLTNIVFPGGKTVDSDFSIEFFDRGLNQIVTNRSKIEVTNLTYEQRLQDEKRNIFVLKPNFLGLVLDDLEQLMPYKMGSTQYVSDSLVRGNDIRLFS